MKKHLNRFFIVAGIVAAAVIFSRCENTSSLKGGILEGTITIGPICPVETIPPSSDCLPTAETYKAYPVGIWTLDGSRRIALIVPALDGSFSMELNPGQYLIRLDKTSGVGGSNLPRQIVISAQEKTTVSIDIDTGIR
jgi:hypothetical protein